MELYNEQIRKRIKDAHIKKQKEFDDLIDKLALKMVNKIMLDKHTQLSYYLKEDQESELLIAKDAYLDYIIKKIS